MPKPENPFSGFCIVLHLLLLSSIMCVRKDRKGREEYEEKGIKSRQLLVIYDSPCLISTLSYSIWQIVFSLWVPPIFSIHKIIDLYNNNNPCWGLRVCLALCYMHYIIMCIMLYMSHKNLLRKVLLSLFLDNKLQIWKVK